MAEFLSFLVLFAFAYGFYYIFRLKSSWSRLSSFSTAIFLGLFGFVFFYALAGAEHYFIAFIVFAISVGVFNKGEQLNKAKESKASNVKVNSSIPTSSNVSSISNSSSFNDFSSFKSHGRKSGKNIIKFTYTNAQGDTSQREVRVDELDDTYIEGYCYNAMDTRTFRLDRIIGLIEQDDEFYLPDDWLEIQGIVRKQTSSYSTKYKPKNLEICFTGFSRHTREELEELAEMADLTVRKSITKNLNFLVTGDNAGPSKISKAIDVGATLLDEDEFREMIETGEIPE